MRMNLAFRRTSMWIWLVALVVVSCKPKGNDHAQTVAGAPEGFEEFYERFHSDSLYQMAHIRFPMQGLPDMADSSILEKGFVWEASNWKMHHPLNLEGYQREFTNYGILISETVRDIYNFGMERRFMYDQMDKQWYLIYYTGMNKFASGAPQNVQQMISVPDSLMKK
jgi:hypothetical protein